MDNLRRRLPVIIFIIFSVFLFPQIVHGADTTLTLKVDKSIYDKFGPFKTTLTGSYRAGPVEWNDSTRTKDGDYSVYKVSSTDAWNSRTGLGLWLKSEEVQAHDGTLFYWNITGINLSSNMTVVVKPDPANPTTKALFVNTTAAPDKNLHIETTNVDSLSAPSTSTGNCSDGIKNGDETGIDTGGRCPAGGGGAGGGGGGGTPATPKAEPVAVGIQIVKSTPVMAKTKCDGDIGKTVGGVRVYANGLLEGVPCNTPITTLAQVTALVRNILNKILLPSAATIFTIMIILGGIAYITSNGNEQRATKAKGILTAAIIGLFITTLAYVLVFFFVTAIGGNIT
jgi:hypothetical protein